MSAAQDATWGWVAIADREPPRGERVEVRHDLNHSYDCKGLLTEDGRWQTEWGFIIPPGLLTFTPTHWRPLAAQEGEA